MKSLHLGKRTAGNILEVIRLIILAQPAGGKLTTNEKPAPKVTSAAYQRPAASW